MERRPEPRRLLGFEERKDSIGLTPARLDRHPERAQVDRPAFAWREHERLAWTCHDDPLPSPLSHGPCHRGCAETACYAATGGSRRQRIWTLLCCHGGCWGLAESAVEE